MLPYMYVNKILENNVLHGYYYVLPFVDVVLIILFYVIIFLPFVDWVLDHPVLYHYFFTLCGLDT